MSVVPGKGGQKFLESTKERLQDLIEYKKIIILKYTLMEA